MSVHSLSVDLALRHVPCPRTLAVFFFNDTATTEIYTLSLHDALPISAETVSSRTQTDTVLKPLRRSAGAYVSRSRFAIRDRKSTRLNSSHGYISYAVFCLKKKKTIKRCPAPPRHHSRKSTAPCQRHHR